MKAIAPLDKSWSLRLTEEEYGMLSSAAVRHIGTLSIGKPHGSKTGYMTWEFWGQQHLELAIEVCKYEGLTLE